MAILLSLPTIKFYRVNSFINFLFKLLISPFLDSYSVTPSSYEILTFAAIIPPCDRSLNTNQD
jgi:hypothetical protein